MEPTETPTQRFDVVMRVTVTATDRVEAARHGASVIRQAIVRGHAGNHAHVEDVEVTNRPTPGTESATTFHAIADGRRLA